MKGTYSRSQGFRIAAESERVPHTLPLRALVNITNINPSSDLRKIDAQLASLCDMLAENDDLGVDWI